MRWIVNLAKPTMTAILVAAPIGNTTVLLLFSLSLETLLTLLLFRERRLRLEAIAVERKNTGYLAAPDGAASASAAPRLHRAPYRLVPLANSLERGHITGQEQAGSVGTGGEACTRGRIIAAGCRR
jgi:hypothetical protein